MKKFFQWLEDNGYGYLQKLAKEDRIGKMLKYLHKRYNEIEKYKTKSVEWDLIFLNPQDIYEDLISEIIEVDK